jgi:hypothetical protein
MEKLYRLVGTAGMCFRAFGVTVGVRVNESRTVATLSAYLPPGSRHQEARQVNRLYSFYINQKERRPGIRRFHTVYCDSQILHRSENETELYEEFERDVDSYIATTSTKRFFVHAGVVGWNARAIVIPGRSYSGKTTLVTEFLRAGATYYSDEFAVFDQRGYVHSFSRPLGLRIDASDKQTRKSAHEFGSRIGRNPIPVGLVILTAYKKSASWQPLTISPGRGVLKLLANSLSARTNPEWALRILTQATEKACILYGVRGEANQVVRSVQEEFGIRFPVALGNQPRLGQRIHEQSD